MARPEQIEWQRRWARAIKHHRAAASITQQQLADWLGIAQQSVGHWEAGRAVPGDLHKIQLVHILHLDLHALFAPLAADPIPPRPLTRKTDLQEEEDENDGQEEQTDPQEDE